MLEIIVAVVMRKKFAPIWGLLIFSFKVLMPRVRHIIPHQDLAVGEAVHVMIIECDVRLLLPMPYIVS